MKRRSFSTLLIGAIASVVAMVIGVISMIIENYLLFGGIALFLAGFLSLGGSLIGYYHHDRFGGIIVLGSTLLYYFTLLIFNTYASLYYFYQALWLNGLLLMLCGFIWLAGILSIYRMEINGTKFDNSVLGVRPSRNLLVIILGIASLIAGFIVVIQQLSVGFIISSIALIIAMGFLATGLFISEMYHTRLGSLLMSASLWFVLAVVVVEINATNVGIIFLLIAITLYILTVIAEWCGIVKPGTEVHIGPKPYRGK